MAIYQAPKTVTDGLIFYYDMYNDKKSWKGAPTTNLISASGIDCSVLGSYTNLTVTRVIDYESPSGYAMQQQAAVAGINGAARATMGTSTSIPTSGNTFISVYVKRINSTANIIPYVYTGAAWYALAPLDGGSQYLTSKYRRFGANCAMGTSSGGPTPAFSMTQGGNTSDTTSITKWHSPQCELQSFATPYVAGTRSSTQAIIDLTGNYTVTPNALTYQSDGNFTFSSGNYLVLSDDCPTIFGTGAVSTTLEMWIKPQGTNNVIYCGQQNTTNERLYVGGYANLWDFGWGGSSWANAVSGTLPACVSGVWQHIVLSINGGIASLYKNGTYAASKTDNSVNMTGTFPIGTYYSSGTKDNGYDTAKDIPVFKIYSRALTADEVQQNFNALQGRYGI